MDNEKVKQLIQEAETNKCKGDSIHECVECGEPFLCYACPDEMNHVYTQTTCRPCLRKWIYGHLNPMKEDE